MDVLLDDVKLPSHLDRLTDTALDLKRVQGMVRVGPDVLFVILSGSLFKLTAERAVLEPVFDSVTRLWSADENCALVESEGALWRVDLDGTKGRLLTIPRGTISYDVKWGIRGLVVGALCGSPRVCGSQSTLFLSLTERKSHAVSICFN